MPVPNTALQLTLDEASTVLSAWRLRPTKCSRMTPLSGGMINSVFELRFEPLPCTAILKVNAETSPEVFKGESEILNFLRRLEETRTEPHIFPRPYFRDSEGKTIGKAVLLLEQMPGVQIGAASLLPDERRSLDEQLADYLGGFLHGHNSVRYGHVMHGRVHDEWVDWFMPLIVEMSAVSSERLSPERRDQLTRLLGQFPELLSDAGPPTLVHGDLWSGNILAARDDGGRVWLSGLIDPAGIYADVEYELAYLECFNTITPHFFEAYETRWPRRPGYELRRRIYWLHTMLIHIWLFEDEEYVQRAEKIIKDLASEL